METIKLYCEQQDIKMYDISKLTSTMVVIQIISRCEKEPKAVIVIDYSVAHTSIKNIIYNEEMCDRDAVLIIWMATVVAVRKCDINNRLMSRIILTDEAEDECSICLAEPNQKLLCEHCYIPYCTKCFTQQNGVCAYCASPNMGVRSKKEVKRIGEKRRDISAKLQRALNTSIQEAKAIARQCEYAKEVKATYENKIKEKRRQRS